ncbi:MAG: phosphodiester glycosidase family protein [Anaerolineae bacterium]|nr:phosphodiester glycosidase family protein [Anaerolineae bacterium]
MDVFPYLATLLYKVADFPVWLLLGLILLTTAGWLYRRRFRAHRFAAAFLAFIALFFVYSSGYLFWYTHRPLPENVTRELFPGVIYSRETRSDPRPLVVHVIRIDLDTPGLHFLLTPPDNNGDLPLNARTTSQFLSEFDATLAINAAFFEPWWSNGIWDYYPAIGEPVAARGLYATAGEIYGKADDAIHFTLYLSEDNQPQFEPPDQVYNALSGNLLFVSQGNPNVIEHRYNREQHPRTAIGFDRDYQTMLLMVVDGRQPNYSEGVDMFEMADIALDYDLYDALNLDGGGSSTLVIRDENGQPVVLNSPINHGLPGHERAVANHLGIYLD